MKLYYSPTSPFVRKVNVLAIETGLDVQIEWLKTNPWLAEDQLTGENPLSKIPTLLTGDGLVLFDSVVICEYLDGLHDREKLIPLQGKIRWQTLCLQALADGILDAGILRLMESKRVPEQQSSDWDRMQKNTIERGINYLESQVSEWSESIHLGLISVGCALGWLDFRYPGDDWRLNHPVLTAWFEQFSNRPSMLKTMPKE